MTTAPFEQPGEDSYLEELLKSSFRPEAFRRLPPAEASLPQDGDLLAFRGRGLFSTAIKLKTFSRVTHVGLTVYFRGRICVLEAREGRGVRLVPLDHYLGDCNVRVQWHPLLSEKYRINRQVAIEWAVGQLGKRYASPWQLVRSWGLLSAPLCDYFGLPIDTNPQRFFCSEFVLDFVRAGGYLENGHRVAARTSPGDVLELDCFDKNGRPLG